MSLSINEKLPLLKEAGQLKKEIPSTPIIERLEKLKRLADIKALIREALSPKSKNTDDKGNDIDTEANKSAESESSPQSKPSEAQKLAGNYKKGRASIYGMDIVIENPKGSLRTGVDGGGNEWSSTMYAHYGDITKTIGNDADPVDIFIGDYIDAEYIFVVDQIDHRTKLFDEHKAMLGFESIADARKGYFKNYDSNWQGFGAIKAFTIDAFKSWVYAGVKNKPVKYIEGQFNEPDTKTLPTIKPSDYEKISKLEVKQVAINLDREGYGLGVVKEVLAHWLSVNV